MLGRIKLTRQWSAAAWPVCRASAVVGGFLLTLLAVAGIAAKEVRAADVRSVAFLGVHLQNDNEAYEPTSDAERGRMAKVEELFKGSLEASGRFKFVPTPPEVRAKIVAGQTIGECGGCEIDYGRALGSDVIAWINVQKVSNLILNMNVYMADVAAQKMTFVRSVDIRGNTDESWTRSLNYLVKNYLLVP